MSIKQYFKKWPLFVRSKIVIFDIFLKRLCKESFENLEFNSNWNCQTHAALFYKMAALKIFWEVTQESSFNSQYSQRLSLRSETISGNWKPLKKHEKYFLFQFNKLNLLLANQICSYYAFWLNQMSDFRAWGLKTLVIKTWFPFSFAIVLQGRHFMVDGQKNFKHWTKNVFH